VVKKREISRYFLFGVPAGRQIVERRLGAAEGGGSELPILRLD
jgi:hypothetical protein